VCPSVCLSAWNNSAPTERIFMKFDIGVFFENMSGKFKLHWNRTSITGALHENQCIFFIMSLSVLIRMRRDSHRFLENINAQVLCSVPYFRNPAVYERRGKILQSGAGHRWHYCACGMLKVTNTHSEYLMLMDFPLQQWLREGASILLCKYIDLYFTYLRLNYITLA